MEPDEMLVDISFPAMVSNQLGTFIKLALRQAQAISLVNITAVITFSDSKSASQDEHIIQKAAITLGAVSPVIIHAQEAENYLVGRCLDEKTIENAARLAEDASRPIDDLRSSRDYRREMVRVCTFRALRDIATSNVSKAVPENPVLLWGESNLETTSILNSTSKHSADLSRIDTRINGKEYTFKNGYEKSLLRLLREDAGLIGTKEGCAEGECGACTVFLDGAAVMSCLVPAARAHGAEIITIEGLSKNGDLHPVQQAFIDQGAVQCGYCTPGFIMSAAKLLEERPQPTLEEIQISITGNLCRCTGYYKIISAIESASQMELDDD
jgi:carbon-monoxide dehydrogenase medium subunit